MANSRTKDPRTLLLEFRERVVVAPALPAREDWLTRIDAIVKALDVQNSLIGRLRQDVEEAEHTRDAANLARMRVFGQLNTLHKTLAAATPNFSGDSSGEPQHVAQRRIQWLLESGGTGTAAAQAAREAEMESPMPGQAVLEAVIAGERKFNKAQLEFSVSEAMVLTNWEMTPLEIMAKGDVWLAQLILKNHTHPAPAQDYF
jgi:hypothetical protein